LRPTEGYESLNPKRFLALLVGGVLLALLLLPMTTTGAIEQNGRIEITATVLLNHGVPLGEPGRPSNRVEQLWSLTDRSGGPIGRMIVVCVWVREPWRLCDGEVVLPLGKLTWSGTTLPPLTGNVAVTGGIGRYFAYRGGLRITSIGERKVVLSFTLK